MHVYILVLHLLVITVMLLLLLLLHCHVNFPFLMDSLAEVRRRECIFFQSLLHKVKIEEAYHHFQSFTRASISPYEVPNASKATYGSHTQWGTSHARYGNLLLQRKKLYFLESVELLFNITLSSAVNNLPMGYPVLQQPPMGTPGQPHMDSMGMSSCHVVNGVPAPSHFHPIRMNSGNE